MWRTCDRLALAGMALGMLLLLAPWGRWPFRTGFFVTLAATAAHIVTSHLTRPDEP